MKKNVAEEMIKREAHIWVRTYPECAKDPILREMQFYRYLEENHSRLLNFRTRGPKDQIVGHWLKQVLRKRDEIQKHEN